MFLSWRHHEFQGPGPRAHLTFASLTATAEHYVEGGAESVTTAAGWQERIEGLQRPWGMPSGAGELGLTLTLRCDTVQRVRKPPPMVSPCSKPPPP